MPNVTSSRGGGAGLVSLSWDKSLGPNIAQGGAIFLTILTAELQTIASEMEAFAKATHPWQNQTGQAEALFTVRVVGRSTIVAKHGAPYGIWLEVKYGGRDGIIPATLEYGQGRMQVAYTRAWAAAWRFS